VSQADRHPGLVVLDADLVKDCGLLPFAQKYPDRFIECGIAEQDMVSMACGLAKRGALPVVHSFACFLSARPNEQIYNQCSEGSKVLYVGSLAGLLPGGPGHSHQSVRDIGALGSIPELLMAEPSVEDEVHALFDYLVDSAQDSSYLRLVSVKWPVPFKYPTGHRVQTGQGWVVREGHDLVVVGYGPWLLSNAWHAIEGLSHDDGVSIRLINLPWLNRVDPAWLTEAIGDCRSVVLLDNHYAHGGQGEMLAAAISELALDPVVRVTRLGVTELPVCGTNDEVLEYHGLDVDSLTASFKSALGSRLPRAVVPSA
jgi:transketolase